MTIQVVLDTMIDLSSFAEPDFDAKAWINDACAQKPADEAVDRYCIVELCLPCR